MTLLDSGPKLDWTRDYSNRENQSSSTGNMRFAAAVPAEADYFDERGIYKEYRPPVQYPAMQQQIGSMNILRKVHNSNNATILSEDGTETSTSDSGSIPTPDFPFIEFPSTEVVNQSQIDFSSISDTLLPRENNNSSSKAFWDARLALKSVQNCPSYEETHEEMREIGDPAVFLKHSQSTRDPTTISIPGNSNFRKSTTGTNADTYSITSRNKCVFRYRSWIQIYHAYWWSSPNGLTRFAFRWLPIEEIQFSSKKGRR